MRNEGLKGKKAAGLCVCFLSLFCLLSCGLEAFYYIDYIPEGDYSDNRAVIRLPSTNDLGYGREGSYFTNFILFYRIYMSDLFVPTGPHLTAPDGIDRAAINSTLNSDYSGIFSSTDITSTTASISNPETIFFNRGYFMVTLAGEDIEKILGGGSLGKTLEIFFDPYNGVRPTLSLDGGVTAYTLQRAVSAPGIPFFQPRPEGNLYRSFLNHADLCNKGFATNEINRDVAVNYKSQELLRYTYVSMYIAATGKSLEMPPKAIYSQPTFVGIFRLTNWS
ncbi:MAG: hypothetical protein LBG95_02310 [Treponema sp.]|jgi:hypothetical protein|nr:hypothetical protein [Treponema sp.]